jgi:hypothetical protein
MRPEIRDRWADALESGRFKQGTDYLHAIVRYPERKDTFCCLGVLCELAVEDGIVERTDTDSGRYYRYGSRGMSSTVDLPPAVMDWAGLAHSNPRIGTKEGGGGPIDIDAVGANDRERWTFTQIAEQLRAMPAEDIR